MNPLILQEATEILSKRFDKPLQILSVTQLSESTRRNILARLHLQGIKKNIIFKKACLDSGENDEESFARFARDWAGLDFLSQVGSQDLHVPQFYGGSISHRFILLEDLGEQHVSLVDSLTGDDEGQAVAALQRFMKCLGQFHGAGYGNTEIYFEILKKLNPNFPSWKKDVKSTFDELFPKIKASLKLFNVPLSKNLSEDINLALKSPLEPGPFTTLIHGDNCPDNVFDDSEKNELHLIDFEWGSVRSALLDGTYLRMSMPTCWCVKAIPHDLIESLEDVYRGELKKKIPAAHDDNVYFTAYTQACGFWMLNVFLEIEKVMEKDRLYYSGPVPEKGLWNPEENSGRPRVLSRLQVFIDVSKKYDQMPYLREMADHVLKELMIKWPDAKPLSVYPAFKERFIPYRS